FIYYYYGTDKENDCNMAMPAGDNPAPNHSGPAGPTIGDQATNDPNTNRGASFAPQMIQRFTELQGNTLKIFYNLSTGNPYGVVLMESDFTVAQPPDFSLAFAQSTVTTGPGKVPVTVNINRMGGFTGNVTVSDNAATPKGIVPLLTSTPTTGNSVTFK